MLQIATTHDYRSADGKLMYQCVRYKPNEYQKCAYRRPARQQEPPGVKVVVSSDGRWVWDTIIDEVPLEKILYRLPELTKADPKLPVCITEGEKDADGLANLGFVSTTNPHGAGNFGFGLCAPLIGRKCTIFEDNDRSGRDHAAKVVGLLMSNGAASVRIVSFRSEREKFDISDWMANMAGDVRRSVINLVKSFPE